MPNKKLKGLLALFLCFLMTFITIPTQYLLSYADSEEFDVQIQFNESDNEDFNLSEDTLTWTPTSNKTGLVNYTCNWTNHEGEYEAGELKFIFSKLGTTRRSYLLPSAITVPEGWDYEISDDGTTTIVNTEKITMENGSDGVFQFSYEINPRQLKRIESQKIMAAVKINENYAAMSNKLYFAVEPQIDTFTLGLDNGEASIEKASLLGENRDTYYWQEYVATIKVDELKSREITDFKLNIEIPDNAEVQAINNKINNNTELTFNSDNYYYCDKNSDTKVVRYLVKYPKDKFDGTEVTTLVKLSGKPIDSNEYIEIAEKTISNKITDYKVKYTGESFAINSARAKNSVFSYNSWTRNAFSKFDIFLDTESTYNESNYDICIFSDFVEGKTKSGEYIELSPDEIQYSMLTVQNTSFFLDSNNEPIEDIKLHVYKKNNNDYELIKSINIKDVKQQIALNNAHDIKIVLADLSGTVKLKSGALELSGRCKTALTDKLDKTGHLNFFYTLQAMNASGQILNIVTKDTYIGSDADRISKRDLNTYGTYLQRTICEVPVTNKNATITLDSKVDKEIISLTGDKVSVKVNHTYQVGAPGEITKFSLYAILPEGVSKSNTEYSVSDKGLTLSDGTKLTNETISEYLQNNNLVKEKIEDNYKNSNRTKITYDFDFSKNPLYYDADEDSYSTNSPINITYTLDITQEAFDKYGSDYEYISAFMLHDPASYYVNTSKDDGAANIIGKENNWKDIDNDNDINEYIEYDRVQFTVNNPNAVQQGLIKYVSNDNTNYTETAKESPLMIQSGQAYSYKLQLNSVYNEVNNIIFYNMLLDDIKEGCVFDGFDISHVEELGYKPDLYVTYSENPGKNIATNWEKYNESKCKKAEVKGVAVDFKDNKVSVGKNVYILIKLKAPEVIKETVTIANQFDAKTTIMGYDTNPISNITYITFNNNEANLQIQKTIGQKEYYVGEAATFDILVKNTGNKDLTNIELTESMNGLFIDKGKETAGPQYIIESLKVGEEYKLQYKVDITENMKDTITNTVIAKVENIMVSDDETITILKDADLSISKTINQSIYTPGSHAKYTIIVTNTGKEDLENVKILESLDGQFNSENTSISYSEKTATIPKLIVGEKVVFTYDYLTPMVDVDTEIINTVTAIEEKHNLNRMAKCSILVKPEIKSIPIVDKPSLSIIKTVDKSEITSGEKLTYEICVTNNGTVPLNDILITDVLSIPNYPGETVGRFEKCDELMDDGKIKINLGINESKTFIYTYQTPANLLNEDIITNTVTAVEQAHNIKESSSVSTKVKASTYDISLKKTAEGKQIKRGDNVIYTLSISNTGTETLKSIRMKESLPGEIIESSKNVCRDGQDIIIYELKPQCSETIIYKYNTSNTDKSIETLENTISVTMPEYNIDKSASVSVDLVEKITVKVPKTGDNTPILFFLILGGISFLGMVITMVLYNKEVKKLKAEEK